MNTQTPLHFDQLESLATAFTPGPWWVGYGNPEQAETSTLSVWPPSVAPGGFGSLICKVTPELLENETDKANARLIAASPELLSALLTAGRTIRAWHGPDGWDQYQHSPEMRQINDAIVKAING